MVTSQEGSRLHRWVSPPSLCVCVSSSECVCPIQQCQAHASGGAGGSVCRVRALGRTVSAAGTDLPLPPPHLTETAIGDMDLATPTSPQ